MTIHFGRGVKPSIGTVQQMMQNDKWDSLGHQFPFRIAPGK